MSKQFLVGNFLPAHGKTFGRMDRKPNEPSLNRSDLERKFERRSRLRSERKTSYVGVLQAGLVLTLIILIVAFRLDLTASSEMEITLAEQEVVQMEEIQQTMQIEKPPPPPRPPVPVEVPNDLILDEELALDLDASLDINAAVNLPPPPPPTAEADEEEEPEIFITVEEMPELIGGMAALNRELDYPETAQRAGVEGTVVVQVIVDENGTPTQPSVLKSVHESLDREAVRAVMEMDFTPGKQRNRPVRVRTNVPVRFRLV